jgi:hypothetical protein
MRKSSQKLRDKPKWTVLSFIPESGLIRNPVPQVKLFLRLKTEIWGKHKEYIRLERLGNEYGQRFDDNSQNF